MTQYASREQIAELDRLAMEEFGLDILQMMEIAGNKFALIVRNFLGDLKHKHILVLAGVGNNGGDGLSSARYLVNWGAEVKIILAREGIGEAAKHHLQILNKMEIDVAVAPVKLITADLIVDALFGYNLREDPRAPYDDLINQANGLGVPIAAFDSPSGLDIQTGKASKSTIRANFTVALAAVKKGLVALGAKEFVGDLFLVDLGIPKLAYEEISLSYPFEGGKENVI